jgi:GNAT superfamily N-acetyltransferase
MSGSEVAGFAHYKLSEEDPTLGEIYEFYVTPEVRCRGIGRMAVNLIHRNLLACGASTSELTANPPAEGFWVNCGYSPTGKCERHRQVMQARLQSDPPGGRSSGRLSP